MIRTGLFAVALAAGVALPVLAADFSLRFIGQQILPTGQMVQGVEFGGLSGIDYDAATPGGPSFWAISDDGGGERGTPRFYNLSLDYDLSGFHGVTVNSQIFMRRPDGSTFPSSQRTVDPEGIRRAPGGNLFWSSEGSYSANSASLYQPFVREMTPAGVHVREFAVPGMYRYVDNATTGGRGNRLFEALAVSPSGSRLYTANEDALIQDGPITSLGAGSVVRVTAFDVAKGSVTGQFAYVLPAIPKPAVPGAPFPPDNGLSELLAVSETRFIAVERAFAYGVGNTIRLVLTDLSGATDVSGSASLAGAAHVPMTKEALFDLDALGITVDNTEGITWGHTLANGNRSLVLVSDNNFSATQVTQFLAFEVVPAPVAQSVAWALTPGGLAATGVVVHRRSR
ncbi:MAG: esterase-like activity of phytase family protein [Betaproteobacteria bacterium]|jgi:hypothetical protein